MHSLEIQNLEKIIKKTKIINDISLQISSGEVVGLLGPNGAGKTTTFYMICGLIAPTKGRILLNGAGIIYKDKKTIQQKVNEMLNLLNIEPIRARKGLSLSGGERRRCEIARSLIITPKFLLLDEPFAGVDPIAVSDIMSIIKELKALNIGILITDHNVRETLSICERAYVIKDGSLLACGASEHLTNNKEVREHYLGSDFRLF